MQAAARQLPFGFRPPGTDELLLIEIDLFLELLVTEPLPLAEANMIMINIFEVSLFALDNIL